MARWANLRRCVRRNLVEVEPCGVKTWCQSEQTGLVEHDKIYTAHFSTPPTITERKRAIEESEVIQHFLQPLSFSVWRFKARSKSRHHFCFTLHHTEDTRRERELKEMREKRVRKCDWKWDTYLYLTSCSQTCPGLLIMVQNHQQKYPDWLKPDVRYDQCDRGENQLLYVSLYHIHGWGWSYIIKCVILTSSLTIVLKMELN